jgi:hypothetical protein
MSVLRLPLEEIFTQRPGERPDPADGGRRPPWRLRRGRGDAAERAGLRWALLAWALVLATLLVQDPERMTFDTKLGVNIDPVGFYERLWHLWNPLDYLGSLQDQYIGYAFPMGLYYLTAHLLHIPVWVAERLWMSLLIAVGFWGLVRLAEALGIGSHATRLLAGAAFALWPTFTILDGGRALWHRGGLHGRHQRGLHPGRARASRDVHPDPPRPAPLDASRVVGGGRGGGHAVVGRAAAVPGPVRVQLPALHRAGGHHVPDHVRGGCVARQRQLGRIPELRPAVADRRSGDDGIGVGASGRGGGRGGGPRRTRPPRPA